MDGLKMQVWPGFTEPAQIALTILSLGYSLGHLFARPPTSYWLGRAFAHSAAGDGRHGRWWTCLVAGPYSREPEDGRLVLGGLGLASTLGGAAANAALLALSRRIKTPSGEQPR
ncbi:hypothetical protein EDB81DRAFT_174265 [Dactylonectria macrodidyma]|uniref:Uncharacterized protein n=1 Tax=Dactylonectria macrodidyma TaxID=307937 RepID=A0A9P9FPD5_9HYPO|nr:hypothetical protein EDB81DRAFT_174265 [Dactylonectria macrodidyma]